MWPGFGDNIRVLDWALRRCDGEKGIAVRTPIGYVPKADALNLEGLKQKVDLELLFSTPKDFWLEETDELRNYFNTQVGLNGKSLYKYHVL